MGQEPRRRRRIESPLSPIFDTFGSDIIQNLFDDMRVRILLPLLLILCAGCHKTPEPIEPKINFAIQDRYLQQLPSPFSPLTDEERQQPWGQEYQIGIGFAHELDLYQAMTSFKRAYFLTPPDPAQRKLELQYDILLSYYLGRKYEEVIYTYENSELHTVGAAFPAAHDLLVILYDSYTQVRQHAKAAQTLEHLHTLFPKTEERLTLSTALSTADFPFIQRSEDPAVRTLLQHYCLEKKSIKQAQTLNALLPGAGYAYIGQKQAAVTAFFLNSLFIAAAVHFFHTGHIAAGIVTTGFEMGWYFGGIHGAKEEATYYNERVWEKHATPFMNKEKLFPVFMLNYAF